MKEEKIITFDDIQRANETIITTDIKGKDYAEVNQRIKAFRMIYPTGTIETELVSNDNGVCVFRAYVYSCNEVDYYQDGREFLRKSLLATGTAYEKEDSSFINKTSYIENCETSAVGRALGMCGFGIDTSVASADEVQNAINNQVTLNTPEEAKTYVITFGKYSGKTLGEVVESDPKYTEWLLEKAQDENIKKGITLITGLVMPSKEEQEEMLTLITEMNKLVNETNTDYEKLLSHYKVKSNSEMSLDQLKDAVKILKERI